MLSIIFSCIFTSRFIPGITNLFLIINYDQPLSLKWNKTTKKSDSLALSPILLFCARFLLLLYAVRTAAAACSLGKMAAIGKVFAINNAEAWKDIIWIIGVIFHAYWIGGGVREEWAASGAYYARTAPIKIVKNFASCGGGAGIREEKTHALGGNLMPVINMSELCAAATKEYAFLSQVLTSALHQNWMGYIVGEFPSTWTLS